MIRNLSKPNSTQPLAERGSKIYYNNNDELNEQSNVETDALAENYSDDDKENEQNGENWRARMNSLRGKMKSFKTNYNKYALSQETDKKPTIDINEQAFGNIQIKSKESQPEIPQVVNDQGMCLVSRGYLQEITDLISNAYQENGVLAKKRKQTSDEGRDGEKNDVGQNVLSDIEEENGQERALIQELTWEMEENESLQEECIVLQSALERCEVELDRALEVCEVYEHENQIIEYDIIKQNIKITLLHQNLKAAEKDFKYNLQMEQLRKKELRYEIVKQNLKMTSLHQTLALQEKKKIENEKEIQRLKNQNTRFKENLTAKTQEAQIQFRLQEEHYIQELGCLEKRMLEVEERNSELVHSCSLAENNLVLLSDENEKLHHDIVLLMNNVNENDRKWEKHNTIAREHEQRLNQKFTVEIDDVKQKVKDLENQNFLLSNKYIEETEKSKLLTEFQIKLQAELDGSIKNVELQKEKVEKYISDKALIKRECRKYEDEIAVLQREMMYTKDMATELQIVIETEESKVEQISKTNERLEKVCKKSNEKISLLERELSKMKEQNNKLLTDGGESILALKTKNNELVDIINESKEKSKLLEVERDNLKDNNSHLNKNLVKVQNKYNELKASFSSLKTNLAELVAVNENYKIKLEIHENDIKTLEAEKDKQNTTAKNEAKKLLDKIARQEDNYGELLQQNEEVKNQLTNLEAERTTQVKLLEQEREELREKIQETDEKWKNEIKNNNNKTKIHKEKYIALENDLKDKVLDYENKLQESETKITELVLEKTNAVKKNESLVQGYDEVKDNLVKEINTSNQIKQSVEALQKQLEVNEQNYEKEKGSMEQNFRFLLWEKEQLKLEEQLEQELKLEKQQQFHEQLQQQQQQQLESYKSDMGLRLNSLLHSNEEIQIQCEKVKQEMQLKLSLALQEKQSMESKIEKNNLNLQQQCEQHRVQITKLNGEYENFQKDNKTKTEFLLKEKNQLQEELKKQCCITDKKEENNITLEKKLETLTLDFENTKRKLEEKKESNLILEKKLETLELDYENEKRQLQKKDKDNEEKLKTIRIKFENENINLNQDYQSKLELLNTEKRELDVHTRIKVDNLMIEKEELEKALQKKQGELENYFEINFNQTEEYKKLKEKVKLVKQESEYEKSYLENQLNELKARAKNQLEKLETEKKNFLKLMKSKFQEKLKEKEIEHEVKTKEIYNQREQMIKKVQENTKQQQEELEKNLQFRFTEQFKEKEDEYKFEIIKLSNQRELLKAKLEESTIKTEQQQQEIETRLAIKFQTIIEKLENEYKAKLTTATHQKEEMLTLKNESEETSQRKIKNQQEQFKIYLHKKLKEQEEIYKEADLKLQKTKNEEIKLLIDELKTAKTANNANRQHILNELNDKKRVYEEENLKNVAICKKKDEEIEVLKKEIEKTKTEQNNSQIQRQKEIEECENLKEERRKYCHTIELLQGEIESANLETKVQLEKKEQEKMKFLKTMKVKFQEKIKEKELESENKFLEMLKQKETAITELQQKVEFSLQQQQKLENEAEEMKLEKRKEIINAQQQTATTATTATMEMEMKEKNKEVVKSLTEDLQKKITEQAQIEIQRQRQEMEWQARIKKQETEFNSKMGSKDNEIEQLKKEIKKTMDWQARIQKQESEFNSKMGTKDNEIDQLKKQFQNTMSRLNELENNENLEKIANENLENNRIQELEAELQALKLEKENLKMSTYKQDQANNADRKQLEMKFQNRIAETEQEYQHRLNILKQKENETQKLNEKIEETVKKMVQEQNAYLRDVVFKLLTGFKSDHVVPVIGTLLNFNEQEMEYIKSNNPFDQSYNSLSDPLSSWLGF